MSPLGSTHSPVVPIATPFDLTDYPELSGINSLTGTGLVARISTGVYATRTLTGTTNQVTVTDGNGVAGNPTISLPQNIHTAATPQFAGIGLGTAYSSGRIQLVSGTTSADGIFWGTDTNLYRSAANTLKTDDSLVVSSGLSVRTLTTGSIPYIGAGGAIGDNNANLFWNNGGTALLIRSNTIGTNGALQVNGTVGVGSSGTNYIRPITNADAVSLILLATQVVVGNVNSDAYSYSGGGRLAVVTNTDSHTLLDVGRNTSTNARFKVVNTTSGQAYTTFENSTTTAFRSFTLTGETIFGASSLATGEGRIHVAPHTTKAGGLYFGAANTNLYSSASGALKTDGVLTIAGTTDSSSSTTGALIVSGGVGAAKDSFFNSIRVGRGASSIAQNIAIGESSPLGAITTGDRNIAIGSGALAAVTTNHTNTAIGYVAGNAYTGLGSTFIGAYAGYGRVSGDYNIVLGGGVGGAATGAGNVMLGRGTAGALTSGAYNTAVGHAAGGAITSGGSNVCIGESAGYLLSQGGQNVIIGAGSATGWYSAAPSLTTGSQNIFIGSGSGQSNVSGNYNVSIGNIAGFLSTTSNNIFIGNMAGRYATTQTSELFIDNQNRTNRAGDIAGAIIYGVMNTTPASQTLALNAQVSLGSPEQVRVTNTASATRYITLTGSNGGNPTISVSAGSLAITPAIVAASTISALAITGNSFIPNAATVPTNGMYLEAANNPAFAANSTKIFEYDSTGIQIAGALTTLGGATFHTTSTALTNGAGAGAGTLTNAPAAGDPSKWIGINDNGTTRYIPAW